MAASGEKPMAIDNRASLAARTQRSGRAFPTGLMRVRDHVPNVPTQITTGRGNVITYCANPVDGQLRARLPPLEDNATLLTADASGRYYYLDSSATPDELKRAPINVKCLA